MSRSWGDLSPPQRRFVAAAKQDNDCIADCDEVEAIARAAGKAHFAYSFADRLYLEPGLPSSSLRMRVTIRSLAVGPEAR